VRERFLGLMVFEISGEKPGDIILHLRRRHAAQKRFADRGVAAQSSAQDDVKGLQRLALGATRGRSLKADVAGPVLSTGVWASVQIDLERAHLVAELGCEPLDNRGQLGLGRHHRVVAMRVADTSDRRGVEAIGVERETDRADPIDNLA
jgi:hypothetical protein